MKTEDRASTSHPQPPPPPLRVSKLPASSERLVRLMQTIGFGKIEHLHVENGQPSFQPAPLVTRERKLGDPPSYHPSMHQTDFYLKAQVVELLALMAQIKSGMISVIDVRFGLPSRVAYPVQSEQ